MRNRKNTTKQERINLVTQFVASGQSQVRWCREQGIAASTFSKWIKEYKSTPEEIKFVPLCPKKSTLVTPDAEAITIENTILIEIGSCKMHVPEKMAMTLLVQAMEVSHTNV